VLVLNTDGRERIEILSVEEAMRRTVQQVADPAGVKDVK